MDYENLFLVVAVIALVVSIFGVFISYNYVSSVKSQISGHATAIGLVNVTVQQTAMISFAINSINWGSGRVNSGEANATLDSSTGSVVGGNWTGTSQGFLVENVGNTNITLNLYTGKDAASFIGGTNPSYQFKITNSKAGSCVPHAGFNLGQWYDVSTISPGTAVCDELYSDSSKNQIRIDVRLVIPFDADKIGQASDNFVLGFAQA